MDDDIQAVSDQFTFEMILKEDIAAELEDFIVLARLGIIDEALEIADHVLWHHLHIFPVVAEVGGFLVQHELWDRLQDLLEELDRREVVFEDGDEKCFVRSLHKLVRHRESNTISIRDFGSMWLDGVQYNSPPQLQTLEILALVAIKDHEVDIASFNYFIDRLFKNLCQHNLWWEATRIFTISCLPSQKDSFLSRAQFQKSLSLYEQLMRDLDVGGSLDAKLTKHDTNGVNELLCILAAKSAFTSLTVALLRKGHFHDFATEIWVLHTEVYRILQKLFHVLSLVPPRGHYIDCWRACQIDLDDLQESGMLTNPSLYGGSLAREVVRETVTDGLTGEQREIQYNQCREVAKGTFGMIFRVKLFPSGEDVAIKKVIQDKRFKDREIQIMRVVKHPNIVDFKAFYYSNGKNKDEVYLNLILEFIPVNIYQLLRYFTTMSLPMPILEVKLYIYQLSRSLAYIHSQGICHRDIKPQNLLVDLASGVLKLCDFGSAKVLTESEPNVSYICSRYYRAPELIFGATNYTTKIDIWSMGCVMAELMLGQPLFLGDSGVDQLVKIVKVLGTPRRDQIQAMNPNYMEYKFPQVKPQPFSKVFREASLEAIKLISVLLEYVPTQRLPAIEVMCQPFFNELRDPSTRLLDRRSPDGASRDLPQLFNFSRFELSIAPHLNDRLVPPHAQAILKAQGLDIDNFLPMTKDEMTVHLD